MIHLAAYISKLLHTSPSPLQRYLFFVNIITHYPSLPYFNTLKFHHFVAQKHISISFFISHTKSPFLENNITHDITQKPLQHQLESHLFTIFNLHIIYLTLPYILQTHSLQNTHIYSLCTFKLHVLQSVHIQDPCPTKYLYIIPIHITNTISHKIYIFLIIPTHLKTYQTLFQ